MLFIEFLQFMGQKHTSEIFTRLQITDRFDKIYRFSGDTKTLTFCNGFSTDKKCSTVQSK